MEGILVTLYDSKAETYTNPAAVESPAAAIRQFDMLVNDKQSTMVSTHPEDFTLFEVATFKDANVQPCAKLALANGVDVKRAPVVQPEPITREIPKGAK